MEELFFKDYNEMVLKKFDDDWDEFYKRVESDVVNLTPAQRKELLQMIKLLSKEKRKTILKKDFLMARKFIRFVLLRARTKLHEMISHFIKKFFNK